MLYGPPGTGKTMLAERLVTILPPLHYDEALETTQIYSASGRLPERRLVSARPFRAPHHSASRSGITGGGTFVRAGEMSLAHHGVLFFDEFPEFHRDTLEALRQPLESGQITIVRADQQATFPARFLFVAACNPCRCGYFGHATIACQCSLHQVQQYRAKLSGPLMDRIDLHVPVLPIPLEQLAHVHPGEASSVIRARVLAARQRQAERYAPHLLTNGRLTAAQTRRYCEPTAAAKKVLLAAIDRHGFSARVYDRILRLGRTIADLAGADQVDTPHVSEALQFRGLDRPL